MSNIVLVQSGEMPPVDRPYSTAEDTGTVHYPEGYVRGAKAVEQDQVAAMEPGQAKAVGDVVMQVAGVEVVK